MPDSRGMPRSHARRRLMTVLFLDIVGSTALAHELGDARWRVVLTNFRSAVRQELKRHGGREQGTEGDSFFAAFAEPVQALRAAAAIAVAAERIASLAPPKRRRRVYLAVAAAVVVALAVAGGILAMRGSSKPPAKITLLQLDPRTGDVVRTIRDGTLGCPCGANLFAVDG